MRADSGSVASQNLYTSCGGMHARPIGVGGGAAIVLTAMLEIIVVYCLTGRRSRELSGGAVRRVA